MEVNSDENYGCRIISTRSSYYTIPSIHELNQFTSQSKCLVQGFIIGHDKYGHVFYPDEIDVSNLNLDEIVHINHRKVTIYPDLNKKPSLGNGLNRRAQITLNDVWPCHRSDWNTNFMKLKYHDILSDVCEKSNAKFINYSPETGTWVFMVDHFTTYGFTEEDELAYAEYLEGYSKEDKETNESEELKEKDVEGITNLPLQREPKDHLMQGFDLESKSSPTNILFEEPGMFVRGDKDNFFLAQSVFDEDVLSDYKTGPDVEMYDGFASSSSSEGLEMEEFRRLPYPRPKPTTPTVYQLYSSPHDVHSDNCTPSHRNYIDMAIFKGKSFKVGWGKGFTLTTLMSRSMNNMGTVLVNNVLPGERMILNLNYSDMKNISNDPFEDSLEKYLQVTLAECKVTVDAAGLPLIEINRGYNYLISCVNVINDVVQRHPLNLKAQYYKHIWNLCVAFWGLEAENTSKTRYKNCSKWFEDVVESSVESKLSYDFTKNINATLCNIFTLLSGHRITDAANLAMKMRLPQLSVLISMLGSSSSVKFVMEQQLSEWKKSLFTIDKNLMDESVTKLYLLLSGNFRNDTVNVCENVDWKRALAMHLWYSRPAENDLIQSIKLFGLAISSFGYAEQPEPPYMRVENTKMEHDILYKIMLLMISESESLEEILSPATHTDDPLDYRLSWLLLQLFKTLHVGATTEKTEIHLHMHFSNQLEHLGLWKWSVFILLFLKDPIVKKNAVMSVLFRNLSVNLDSEELQTVSFLVHNFKLPVSWIHKVHACKTGQLKKHWQTYRYLTYCQDWNECHQIAIQHLIPDLVSSNQFEVLIKILEVIHPFASQILNWDTQAGIVVDYTSIRNILNTQLGKMDDHTIMTIQSEILGLCRRISNFKITTPQQALWISELSSFITQLIKNFIPEVRQPLHTMFFISQLVMAPDYRERAKADLIDIKLLPM